MTDLTFDDLRWLHLLWAVLAIALVGIYGIWQRRRALRIFADANLLPRLTPGVGWFRGLVRVGLTALALVALVAALVGTRWGREARPIVRRNIDIMVLLDVSRSMLARDIAPNRLERAKLSIRDDLLPALGGDRIGLITFAGTPTLACPLTIDYGTFRLALDDVTVRSAARGGTLIGDAIRLAGDTLDDDVDSHKFILLITDGEDHESFPVQAAAAAWQDHQIAIIALGLGDSQVGSPIPLGGGAGERYLTYQGEVVRSKADFATLQQLSNVSTGGLFVPVGTRNFDLSDIYRRIARSVRFAEDADQQRIRHPLKAHLFALLALVAVLIETCVRPGRRLPRARAATGPLGEQEAA